MIVIALSSLFILSAMISYRTFFSDNQLTVLVNNLDSALRYARYAAITLHADITLCPRGDNNTCGSDWQNGQLIMNENNKQVLRLFSALPNPYRLLWTSPINESMGLQWRPNGFTRGQEGSFFICARNDAALSAKIMLLRTGRLRSEIGHFAACASHATLRIKRFLGE